MEKLLATLLTPLTAAGPVWTLVAVLIVLFILAFYFLFKAYLNSQADHKYQIQKIHKDHKEDHKDVVKQMFEVINRNTESNQALKDAVNELRIARIATGNSRDT